MRCRLLDAAGQCARVGSPHSQLGAQRAPPAHLLALATLAARWEPLRQIFTRNDARRAAVAAIARRRPSPVARARQPAAAASSRRSPQEAPPPPPPLRQQPTQSGRAERRSGAARL